MVSTQPVVWEPSRSEIIDAMDTARLTSWAFLCVKKSEGSNPGRRKRVNWREIHRRSSLDSEFAVG
jgi:hypothetical protein